MTDLYQPDLATAESPKDFLWVDGADADIDDDLMEKWLRATLEHLPRGKLKKTLDKLVSHLSGGAAFVARTAPGFPVVPPVAVKVKPLVWNATGDAGACMAYDPLFERQVLSLEPAAYDTERSGRILAALDVQPLTVQDAARVPEIAALMEAVDLALDAFCVLENSEQISAHDALLDAMRAIAEGRA